MKIFALSGSLRQKSLNMQLLKLAQSVAGAQMIFDFATPADLPLFNEDLEAQGLPDAVSTLANRIAQADALLIATPEYNYAVPGGLKNLIDWVSRIRPNPMSKKPIAILSASLGRFGGARVQYQLRHSLLFLDPDMVNQPEIMVGNAAEALQEPDERLKQQLQALLSALVEKVEKSEKGTL